MKSSPFFEKSITFCKLKDGRILQYDACHSVLNEESKDFHRHMEYMGEGWVYSVNGILQYAGEPNGQTAHFWKHKTTQPMKKFTPAITVIVKK